MNVDRSEPWNGQDRLRKNLTVGGNHREIGLRCTERGKTVFGFDRIGLHDNNAAFDRKFLQWIRVLMVTSSLPIGLSD
jgi:hypothetical protein